MIVDCVWSICWCSTWIALWFSSFKPWLQIDCFGSCLGFVWFVWKFIFVQYVWLTCIDFSILKTTLLLMWFFNTLFTNRLRWIMFEMCQMFVWFHLMCHDWWLMFVHLLNCQKEFVCYVVLPTLFTNRSRCTIFESLQIRVRFWLSVKDLWLTCIDAVDVQQAISFAASLLHFVCKSITSDHVWDSLRLLWCYVILGLQA